MRRYPVAFTWVQPEAWDWAREPGNGLRLTQEPAGDGPAWPAAPAHWRPGHRVYNVTLRPQRPHILTFGRYDGKLDVDVMVPPKGARRSAEALLRRAVAHTVGGEAMADLMLDDLLRSEGGRPNDYATFRWPWSELDRPIEDEPILPTDPRLELDLAGLAALGDWRLETLSPGSCSFERQDWSVKVKLPVRQVSDGEAMLEVDAGGLVVGPGVDRELDEPEQQAETERILRAWGAPAPHFGVGAMRIKWPKPWGPEHSIRLGLGSDRWGGPGVW